MVEMDIIQVHLYKYNCKKFIHFYNCDTLKDRRIKNKYKYKQQQKKLHTEIQVDKTVTVRVINYEYVIL